MRRSITAIFLTLALSLSIVGCSFQKSDLEMIEDRIDAFLSAYNSGDLSAVFECLDVKTRNTYKALFGIGNSLVGMTGFGIDIYDLWAFSVGTMSDGDMLTINIDDINFVDENHAIVSAAIRYKSTASGYTENVQIIMTKENGDWFLNDPENW